MPFAGLPVLILSACPDTTLFFALVVDRVALVGRCSEPVTLVVGAAERGVVFLTLCGRTGTGVFAVVIVAVGMSEKISSFPSQSFVFLRLTRGVLRVVRVVR